MSKNNHDEAFVAFLVLAAIMGGFILFVQVISNHSGIALVLGLIVLVFFIITMIADK